MATQAKWTENGMAASAAEWYERHSDDYAAVRERLERARAVTLDGDVEDAAANLRKSYMFAVLSVRTALPRHERAYAGWVNGRTSAKEAMLDTVYGGSKVNQWGAPQVLEGTDWTALARDVREHVRAGEREALMSMHEHVRGVGLRKWGFTLAMVGLYEVACIDSNVEQIMADVELADGWDADASAYLDAVEQVRERAGAPEPFLGQWCVYDFNRGEHARHMVFFNSLAGF